MNVVLDSLGSRFGWGLEQRADIDIESQVGEGGGNHFRAAIMAILSHLGDQDARAPPFRFFKVRHHSAHLFDLFLIRILGTVDPRNAFHQRLMPP